MAGSDTKAGLTREEIIARLKGAQAPTVGLTRDEIIARLKGGASSGGYAGYNVLGGSALETSADIARGVGLGIDYMGAMKPPSTYGSRGALPFGQGGNYAQGPQFGKALTEPVAGALEAKAQEVYPEASRGKGGFPERVLALTGQVAPGLVAGAVGGPGVAGAAFGLQAGVPEYHNVLSKTGDPDKAMAALLGNAAVASVLENIGVGGTASRIIRKLAKVEKATGGAVTQLATLKALLGGAAKEYGTEILEQGLSAKIREQLTGEDQNALAEMLDVAKRPEVALVGGFGGFLEGVVGHGGAQEQATTDLATKPQPQGELAAPKPAEEPALTFPKEGTKLRTLEEARAAEAPTPAQEPLAEPSAIQGSAPNLSVEEETAGPDLPEPPEAPGSDRIRPDLATTGIKNATVEKELEEMGLPIPEGSEGRSFVKLHADAKAKFDKDQRAGEKLVESLEAKPRSVSDAEDALLTFEANRLIQERKDAQEAFNADPSEENQARIDKAQAAYGRTADVLKKAGGETARGLNARKMMLADDYSLAGMERAVQVAKGGKKLTPKEQAKIADLHSRLEVARLAHEKYVSEADLRAAELEAENARLREEKKIPRKERKKAREAAIAKSKAKIDELFNKLASGTKAAAGLDPIKVRLTVELAAEHIKLGYQNFAQWADEVVARVGEHIRPYLRSAWDQAQKAKQDDLLKRYKARKPGEIAKVVERTRRKDFSPPRRADVASDPEAVRLKTEYEMVRREFEREKERHRIANRTGKQKAMDAVKKALRTPGHIWTSLDFSAVLRQGLMFSVGHPIKTVRHVARMFSAMASPKAALRYDTEIRNRPLYQAGERAGLELTELDEGLGPREENLARSYAESIPGLGKLVKASNRGFTTFLNLQRAEHFDRMASALPESSATPDAVRAIANFVNIATGRGNPGKGKLARSMEAVGEVLWAPKLYLARLQALTGAGVLHSGARGARKAIAKEYARTLIGLSSVYALAQLADGLDGEDDVEITFDPRSADFGKIKLGNTRIDPLGGFAQFITLIGRVASGETKSKAGKVTPTRGDVPFGKSDAWDVITDFGRNKLAPIPGLLVDVLAGENAIGEPTTPTGVASRLVTPISFQDIKEAMEDQGVAAGAAEGILALFGAGLQTYETKAPSKAKVR